MPSYLICPSPTTFRSYWLFYPMNSLSLIFPLRLYTFCLSGMFLPQTSAWMGYFLSWFYFKWHLIEGFALYSSWRFLSAVSRIINTFPYALSCLYNTYCCRNHAILKTCYKERQKVGEQAPCQQGLVSFEYPYCLSQCLAKRRNWIFVEWMEE